MEHMETQENEDLYTDKQPYLEKIVALCNTGIQHYDYKIDAHVQYIDRSMEQSIDQTELYKELSMYTTEKEDLLEIRMKCTEKLEAGPTIPEEEKQHVKIELEIVEQLGDKMKQLNSDFIQENQELINKAAEDEQAAAMLADKQIKLAAQQHDLQVDAEIEKEQQIEVFDMQSKEEEITKTKAQLNKLIDELDDDSSDLAIKLAISRLEELLNETLYDRQYINCSDINEISDESMDNLIAAIKHINSYIHDPDVEPTIQLAIRKFEVWDLERKFEHFTKTQKKQEKIAELIDPVLNNLNFDTLVDKNIIDKICEDYYNANIRILNSEEIIQYKIQILRPLRSALIKLKNQYL